MAGIGSRFGANRKTRFLQEPALNQGAQAATVVRYPHRPRVVTVVAV